MRTKNNFGFSLVELLVIIAILLVLFGISINTLPIFKKSTELSDSAEKVLNTLKLAQSKTLASEEASQYGVYFNSAGNPNQYILFKGENYILRDASADLISQLPKSIEIYEVTLSGSEVVFNRLTGEANQTGDISLRIKGDPSKTKTISIKSSGQITLGEESAPNDNNRVKDSRHLHFDYNRPIITTTESLTLTFSYDSSTVTKVINIADNIQDGQIYWEGEVNVNGQNQRIKIHTHQLNNPNTIFCIHRDRRFNDKALTVTISGDTGSLVEYSSDGLTTNSTSIFVNNLLWQ